MSPPGRFLDRTLSSLCESICDTVAGPDPRLAPSYEDVLGFVERQLGRVAPYFRIPLLALLGLMAISTLFTNGRLFHELPADSRRSRILGWKRSRIPVLRDFVRFLESLCVMALYNRLMPPEYAIDRRGS
jgi:hypothetical protein